MDRLTHVLSVGAAAGARPAAPAVIELTDAEFEQEIDRFIGEAAIDMTAEERRELRNRALKEAAKRLQEAGKHSKDAYDATRRAGVYASEKSTELAQEIVDYVHRAWAGAKKPSHWAMQEDHTEAATRLIRSYKMHFEKIGWENIKAATAFPNGVSPTRVIYAETGMNLHAKIHITLAEVTVTVANSMPGRTEEKTGNVEFGALLKTTPFVSLTAAIDNLIMKTTQAFYREYATKYKKAEGKGA